MASRYMMASLVLCGLALAGCEKKADAPATPPPPKAEPTTKPAAGVGAALGDATAGLKDAAAGAGKALGDKAADAKDAAAGAAAAGAAAGAKDTAAGAKDAAAAKMEQAKAALGGEDPQSLFDKAMQYIKDNKLNDAQAILDKFDAAKGKLPPEWAAKVDQLKAALTTAKGAAGALPGGLPSLSK